MMTLALAQIKADLKDDLAAANLLKTGERSDDQRHLAILCTKIEDALAWSEYMEAHD